MQSHITKPNIVALIGCAELGRELGVTRQRAHQLMNREKHRARRAVANALSRGQLMRPSECANCTQPCIPHGHHVDYAKKLDIQWLCEPCHKVAHMSDRCRKGHPYTTTRRCKACRASTAIIRHLTTASGARIVGVTGAGASSPRFLAQDAASNAV